MYTVDAFRESRRLRMPGMVTIEVNVCHGQAFTGCNAHFHFCIQHILTFVREMSPKGILVALTRQPRLHE